MIKRLNQRKLKKKTAEIVFIHEADTEAKKKELFTNSVVVIGSVLIVSVIIFLLDLGFNELTNLEIKAISGNKENTTVENVVDENNETVDANSVETTGDAETSATQTPEEGTENAETEENSQSFEVQE